MPQQDPAALASQLITAGENKARQGQTLAREAQMMADAARTIAGLLEENTRLRDAFEMAQYTRTHKSRRPQNTILVDGSASMLGNMGHKKSLLSAALDSACVIKKHEPKTNAFLFGTNIPWPVILNNPEAVDKARQGHQGSSELAPTLKSCEHTLRTGKHRLIIMGDSYICDYHTVMDCLNTYLDRNPELAVEFIAPDPNMDILAGGKPSKVKPLFETMAETLQKFHGNRVTFTPTRHSHFASATAFKPLPPARKQSPKI